jgi:Zn-dependent peptidase ImmA (M78 family)
MTKIANYLQGLALSVDEVAVKARIPSSRVRAILEGEEATLAELRALARALRIPLRYFGQGSEDTSDLAVLFRARASQRRDFGVESVASFVQAALAILPPRKIIPEWLRAFELKEETYQEASRLADDFRVLFTPDRLEDTLFDLPDILVNLGDVILSRLETSRFEGASVVADGYPFIFVSPRFSGRMLFTLAHELGHLIAHHKEDRSASFDRPSQIGAKRRYNSKSEAFANAFASVVLMPARGVGIALKQIRQTLYAKSENVGDVEILYLARLYGVSFEVAALRCEKLGLLAEGGAWSLAEHLRRHHGSPEKRADAVGIPKRRTISIPRVSQNLLKVAAEQIEKGTVSLGWVSDRFGCSAKEVYAAHAASEVNRGPYH